jgi:hypothetical protein
MREAGQEIKAAGWDVQSNADESGFVIYTGEYEGGQPTMEKIQQGDDEMNLEEMVRAAVRKALDEKKYRREDDEDEKNEAIVEEDKGDDDEPQGDLSAAQKELDLDDDGKIEPSDLKGLRSGKKDDDVGKEKEETEEKNESFAAMLSKKTDKINKQSRDSAETLKKLKTKDDGTYDYEQGEEEEKIDEFLGAKLQKNIKKVNKKGTDNVKATAGHVARMEKEEEEKEEALVPETHEPGHAGFDPSQVQSVEDPEYGGMIHTIPGVELTGDVESDVWKMAGDDEELYSWLWGEMESGDSITDSKGQHVYSGSDVQDILKAVEDDFNNPGSKHHYQEASNKEWYDSKLFDSLKRKWAK